MSADAAGILDDVVSMIGADVATLKEKLQGNDGKPQRVLTGEEARILSGYARALTDVSRAKRAADDDGLTPEEQKAIEALGKDPRVREILTKAGIDQ